MVSSNSLLVSAIIASLLLLTIHCQSPTVKRNLLSEGMITSFDPSDSQCCEAGNCVDEIIPSCAVDGDPTTIWTLRNGTMKAHISIQLNSSSLVSDISVMLSPNSVIPSSIVVTASGTKIAWTTYFNDTCQPNDEYLRRKDSQYYSCKRSGRTLTVSVPEGLFSIRNASSDGWLWWETFNQFNLIIENNTNSSGSIEIADVQLYGWDAPMTTSCNCHPVGVIDVEKPCTTDGRCSCRGGSTSSSQCIPDANIADPTYGPESGGTVFNTAGDFLANATNVTLGDNYDCKILLNNDTLLQVKTSNGSDSDLRSSIPARIHWERPQGVVSLIVANWEFTFKPDPVIDSVSPMISIISGGIPQTVTGENLDSVAYPFITLVIKGYVNGPHFANYTNSDMEPNDTFCRHINSTMLECITPDTDNYPEDQDEFTSSEITTLMISMDINKYNDYNNCEFNDKKCDFTRTENPTFDDWGDDLIYNVYDGVMPFRVYGHGFTVGSTVGPNDYSLTVGGVQCEIIDLSDNIMSFYPPDPSSFTSVDDAKSTIVYVGYYSYTVGKIQYYLSWIDNPVNRNGLIIGLVVGVGGLIILILIIVLWRTHRKSKKTALAATPRSPVVHYNPPEIRYTTAPQRDPTILDYMNPEQRVKVEETLVPFTRLQFEEEIGSGNFGKVYRGLFFKTDDDLQEVAIKTILNSSMFESHEKVSFLQEAMIMKDFSHPNVLSLIAVAIENDFPYVVLPLMENGDLRGFVTTPDKLMSVLDLTSYSLQVAEGMAYLAENKFVHRDLAARNCMINKDFVVKVADFGLARDIYEHDYYRTTDNNRPLPVKWMALECLTGVAKFTESSDVWSFGVLMWELFTRGRRPYADVDNSDIKRFLLRGKRLEKPRHTPEFIYGLMKSCWEEAQSMRPRFKELVATLKDILFHASENSRTSLTPASSDDEAADPNQVGLHIGRRHPVSYLDLRRNVPSAYFEQPQEDVGSDPRLSKIGQDSELKDGAGSIPRLSKYGQDSDFKVTQDGAWTNPRLSKYGHDSDFKVTQDVARSSQQLTQAIPGSDFKQMKYDTGSNITHKQDNTGSTQHLKQDDRYSDDDTGSSQQVKQDDRNSNFNQKQDDAGPIQQVKQDDRNSDFNQTQDESRSSQRLSQNGVVTNPDKLRYFVEDLV